MNTNDALTALRTRLQAELDGANRAEVVEALYEQMDEIDNQVLTTERAAERVAAEATEFRALHGMLRTAERAKGW
jgi:hypothetical protein